jgi:hypothetical protein
MDRIQHLISQIRIYAEQHGITPQLAGRRLGDDPLLFDRLVRRDEATDRLIARVMARTNSGANRINGNDRNRKRGQKKPLENHTPDAIGRFDE